MRIIITAFLLLFILCSNSYSQVSPLAASITHSGNGCNGGNTVSVHINGGVPPYKVEVSGQSPSQILYSSTGDTIFSGLNPDSYLFIIRDSHPAQSHSFYLPYNIPAAYGISFNNSTANCNPNQLAQSQYTFTGISVPYSMQWSSGSQVFNQTALIGNAFLDKGTHRVTVVDANNCELYFRNTILGSNFNLNVTLYSSNSLHCGDTSSINSQVTGYSSPYSYLWTYSSGTAITPHLNGQGAGTYNLRVTGSTGCRVNEFAEIREKKGIFNAPAILNPSCNGNNGQLGYSVPLS